MPKKGKKGGKKKKKGKKKKLSGTNESPAQVVMRLLKTYERNCGLANSLMCPALRNTMKDYVENDNILVKVFVCLYVLV